MIQKQGQTRGAVFVGTMRELIIFLHEAQGIFETKAVGSDLVIKSPGGIGGIKRELAINSGIIDK
jgi:hypothetical protein